MGHVDILMAALASNVGVEVIPRVGVDAQGKANFGTQCPEIVSWCEVMRNDVKT